MGKCPAIRDLSRRHAGPFARMVVCEALALRSDLIQTRRLDLTFGVEGLNVSIPSTVCQDEDDVRLGRSRSSGGAKGKEKKAESFLHQSNSRS